MRPLAGRRLRPLPDVPLLTPRLSSSWVALVTSVKPGLIEPLVDGFGAKMLVRTTPPRRIDGRPSGFDDAVRAAPR